MFVASNKLADLIPYFIRKLKHVYDEREIESIFFLITETKFGIKKSTFESSDKRLSESELLEFRDIVNDLLKFKPVQQILGEADFYGMKFLINEHVLIPRPETEELADLIIHENKSNQKIKILDIGTGSGCIAVTLKKNLPEATLWACDISDEALKIARSNAEFNQVQVQFIKQDILTGSDSLPSELDIIVSNPPYILNTEKKDMHQNVLSFEPHLALFVEGTDPILFYRNILEKGKGLLKQNGLIYFELNPLTAQLVKDNALDLGYQVISAHSDISGKERILKVQLKS
ncbi:MAG: peptide chain release factor N(5)-glutamine methyltransferase [Crocinitomicaceae bacterium]|nr:peptide chain release factor N(5)-glutamine methyltransferase [Crocinitomicaceae bacterium]